MERANWYAMRLSWFGDKAWTPQAAIDRLARLEQREALLLNPANQNYVSSLDLANLRAAIYLENNRLAFFNDLSALPNGGVAGQAIRTPCVLEINASRLDIGSNGSSGSGHPLYLTNVPVPFSQLENVYLPKSTPLEVVNLVKDRLKELGSPAQVILTDQLDDVASSSAPSIGDKLYLLEWKAAEAYQWVTANLPAIGFYTAVFYTDGVLIYDYLELQESYDFAVRSGSTNASWWEWFQAHSAGLAWLDETPLSLGPNNIGELPSSCSSKMSPRLGNRAFFCR